MLEFGLEWINLNLARRFGFSEEKKEMLESRGSTLHCSPSTGEYLREEEKTDGYSLLIAACRINFCYLE